MKLAALFSQYLYQHKKLSLPGIGVFSIDPSLAVPDHADKNFSEYIQQIRYVQKPVAAADEEFINFIRTQTGKIKPLAESDLDSFLSDAKILLNIGKPFFLEGIGSLLKNKAGAYEFTPGESEAQRRDMIAQRRESYPGTESPDEHSKRSQGFNDYRSQDPVLQKVLIVAGVIVGLIVVIWLGYSLYSRNANDSGAAVADREDTTAERPAVDSAARTPVVPPATRQAGTYKFIIERTANKGRAYRRFSQIRDNLTDIRMESDQDSTLFKLYFILPAQPSDTTRIKDSLKIWYGRREVFIEQ